MSNTPPFPPATHANWLAQVQKDLRDPAALDTLTWAAPAGFAVVPYCTAEQTAPLAEAISRQQAVQKATPGWLNTPAYTPTPGHEKTGNLALRHALANGADALLLHIPAGLTLTRLLDGIKLSTHPVFFRLDDDVPVEAFLTNLCQIAPYQLRGGLLARSGTLPPAALAVALRLLKESPGFRVAGLSSDEFHNNGANATQELAFTLAQLADLRRVPGLSDLPALWPRLAVSMPVGTSYFMEIAKLRAMRVLLTRLEPAANPASVFVHASTSAFCETAATPYTNLVRATTESLAAVIGGADALTIRPYDAVFGTDTPTEFSQRIARNISNLLVHEGYLGHVADPGAGSHYLETLTHQLAEAAWQVIEQVEQLGGLAAARQTGFIQTELDRTYQAQIRAIEDGQAIVGVTKYRHDEPGSLPTPPVEDGVRRRAKLFE